MNLGTPLVPTGKDGVFRVLIPGRISTPGQDVESIASTQEDAGKWLEQVYKGRTDVTRLGDQASGWLADRPTMETAEGLITGGLVDLVLVTEMREIYRNPAFQWAFVHMCIDNDVRFISLADNIDTADENWEMLCFVASLRHGMEVPATRRRVRRKASYSFSKGGMVLKVRFGYRKLSKKEAASGKYGTVGLRIVKLSECTLVLREMRRRIMAGASYVEVAAWLTAEGIETGPYVTSQKWSAALVSNLLYDPILSGRRQFRVNIHRLIYGSGKHRSEPNPKGPAIQEYPELAHFTAEEHTSLLEVMVARKEASKKGPPSGKDSPLWNRARDLSLWPGRQATCGRCEGPMYRCGKFLRCRNSLPGSTDPCWNHVQVPFTTVRDKVVPWVLANLGRHPGFRDRLVESAWRELDRRRRRTRQAANSLDRAVEDLEGQARQLAKAIAKGGKLESLVDELKTVETSLAKARKDRGDRRGDADVAEGFESKVDVAARLDEAVMTLALTSLDVAAVLRRLLPTFTIVPVQDLSCPQIRPRAELVLRVPDAEGPGLEASATMDLFDPPVHIKHLAACVAAKQAVPKAGYDRIARAVGVGKMTVKRAFAYHRLMQDAGVSDPYQEVMEQPPSASRWK